MRMQITSAAIPLILAGTAVALGAHAYTASSTSYRIQFDSVNVGGVLSTSTSYRMEDTVGEIATGVSSSTAYQVKAGYQQMNEIFLSLSAPADVTLSPSISGTLGGTANGNASWTVLTDGPAGYSLSLRADATPAMRCSGGGCSVGVDNFADYTPAGAGTPDFTFSVAATAAEFGFSPEGTDIVQKFKDNGAACDAGALDAADSCWLNTATTNETIARSAAANHPSGTATTVKFRAVSGASNVQPAGSYSASIVITAVAR